MKKQLLILGTIGLLACSSKDNLCGRFDLNHPAELIKLPAKLKEISGITFLSKNKIACVQDEKGTVFIYDIRKDKLKESIDFGGNKDYEAITNANDTIYVLRSNGDIHEIDQLESDSVHAITHHTFLSKINNCEGMCYDSKMNRLLIACKGRPEKGSAKRYEKAVYAFDLSTKTMKEEPVLVFNPDVIINATKKEGDDPIMPGEKENMFEPSEITIDPSTGNYFILSSVGKRLAVFTPSGELVCASKLDPEIFKQPEGIAFTSTGDLIISDEGRNGKANLVVVKQISNTK